MQRLFRELWNGMKDRFNPWKVYSDFNSPPGLEKWPNSRRRGELEAVFEGPLRFGLRFKIAQAASLLRVPADRGTGSEGLLDKNLRCMKGPACPSPCL
jgi:hypothetical protein